jgi:hypothetical protein
MKLEMIDSLALARWIRAAGRPIYIAEDDGEPHCIPSDGLIVYQVGGAMESSAFECSGGTGLMVELVITINLSMLAISYFDLELPWEKIGFCWLPDPLEIDGSSFYRFGSRDLEFERIQVINHRADVRRNYSRGQSIRGLLLGLDMAPIPDASVTA